MGLCSAYPTQRSVMDVLIIISPWHPRLQCGCNLTEWWKPTLQPRGVKTNSRLIIMTDEILISDSKSAGISRTDSLSALQWDYTRNLVTQIVSRLTRHCAAPRRTCRENRNKIRDLASAS
jgi:hypothetical protein